MNVNRAKALSKCIVWFKDGNIRTFYSLDQRNKEANPDQAVGIRRLEKMLFLTFKGKWETAIIYENQSTGCELIKYRNDRRVAAN